MSEGRRNLRFWLSIAGAAAAVAGVGLVFTFESPRVRPVQQGYRGIGMEQVYHQVTLANIAAANVAPAAQDPVDPAGVPSKEAYQNVQVLGDLDANEFVRLMTAITEWVAPTQGCTYCHAEGEDLSADTLYTKRVARRMLQMTQQVNATWKPHVGETGVTCYTCHRGQPVPSAVWATAAPQGRPQGMLASETGQNRPAPASGLASLPYDPFTPFLLQDYEIRVNSPTDLPRGNRSSIKQAEWTYGLMVHMAEGLGVNCTYCHNSRAFWDWSQSSPQRVNAWHGIRMTRAVNQSYIQPLQPVFPAHRLGELGDPLKVNCTTCHQGAYKPLYGAPVIKDYPELAGPGGPATTTPAPGTNASTGGGGGTPAAATTLIVKPLAAAR
jgi:photosynthetic reaction center cytochrome c subunit